MKRNGMTRLRVSVSQKAWALGIIPSPSIMENILVFFLNSFFVLSVLSIVLLWLGPPSQSQQQVED